MKFTSTSPRRNEEGMALLFALGFLAMLLVLGLGFVTTSLLSQKIAANNATRVQARMLARSAAARAALAIMLYNDQAIVNDATVSNYDSVCSYDQVDYNDNGTIASGKALNDQFRKGTGDDAAASLLKYLVGGAEYTGEKSNAKWIYFYDSPKKTGGNDTVGRKIIGRAAFQVLPESTRWLSLYGVTGGAKLENDLGVIPYNFRWGRGVEELCLNNTRTFHLSDTENWYTSAIKTKIPFVYDTLYNTYSDFFVNDSADKKKWVEGWFTEGRNTVIKEAFPVLDSADASGKKVLYYNRFNIGDFYYDSAERNSKDNWYDRFKAPAGGDGWTGDISTKKNSPDALAALTAEAVPYQENDADDTALDSAGLPFLRRIGNDPGAYESLELLRKQIAANFNDYCDSDSIPTSDVKASSWSITDSANFPKYTGNEKTLYVNEIACMMPLEFNVRCARSGHPLRITPRKNQLRYFVELINMFDNSEVDANSMLNPANVKAEAKVESLSFKIALYGSYKFTVTYLDEHNHAVTTPAETVEINENYSDDDYALKLRLPDDVPSSIENFSALVGGYSKGNSEATLVLENQTAVEDSFLARITEAVNNRVPAGCTLQKYTFTDVKIGYKYKDFKIKFSPVLLCSKKTVSGVIDANCGIDFVRFDRVGEFTPEAPNPEVADKIIREGWTHTFRATSLIGGFEALDPRQNLNPRLSGNSDWFLAPNLILARNWSAADRIPSMTIDANNDTISAGAVNRYSSPAAPKDHSGTAFAAGSVDKENAVDPAWLGEAAGKHVSTAYIRNSPMVSPWEVGFIHRGRPWRTLNIKRAGGFGANQEIRITDIKAKFDNWSDPGTVYENGDGAIFEYTKMSTACRAMGKVPLGLLRTEVITKPADYATNGPGNWNGVAAEYNKDIVKMIFDGIRRGQTGKELFAESKFGTAATAAGGTAVTTGGTVVNNFITEIDKMLTDSELKLRCQFLNSDYGANEGDTAFTFGLVTNTNNDAACEELIGKTINLLAVTEETPPNVFRVIVVAQTIRDVGGIDDDVTITKLHNGDKQDLSCRLGRFDFISDATDWEKNTYFDEITGEVKALVTIERVPALDDTGAKNPKYGRMVITKIEYID